MACHAHTFDPQVRLVLVLCLHLWWVSTSATGKERFIRLFVISPHQHMVPKPPWLDAVLGNRTLAKSSVSSGLWATTFSFKSHESMYEKCYLRTQEFHHDHHDNSIDVIISQSLCTYSTYDVFHILWNISDRISTQNDTFGLIFSGPSIWTLHRTI